MRDESSPQQWWNNEPAAAALLGWGQRDALVWTEHSVMNDHAPLGSLWGLSDFPDLYGLAFVFHHTSAAQLISRRPILGRPTWPLTLCVNELLGVLPVTSGGGGQENMFKCRVLCSLFLPDLKRNDRATASCTPQGHLSWRTRGPKAHNTWYQIPMHPKYCYLLCQKMLWIAFWTIECSNLIVLQKKVIIQHSLAVFCSKVIHIKLVNTYFPDGELTAKNIFWTKRKSRYKKGVARARHLSLPHQGVTLEHLSLLSRDGRMRLYEPHMLSMSGPVKHIHFNIVFCTITTTPLPY